MINDQVVIVHPEQIPEDVLNVIGRSLCSIIQEYYSIPEHMQEFEDWKKQQSERGTST